MYRILLFLMGRGHERSLSVRRVGGRGSTPLLACGCTILLGLWLGVTKLIICIIALAMPMQWCKWCQFGIIINDKGPRQITTCNCHLSVDTSYFFLNHHISSCPRTRYSELRLWLDVEWKCKQIKFFLIIRIMKIIRILKIIKIMKIILIAINMTRRLYLGGTQAEATGKGNESCAIRDSPSWLPLWWVIIIIIIIIVVIIIIINCMNVYSWKTYILIF